ncbi:butanediol dehydrogenase [Niallia circulans]|jgi:(R,R)-butanediol dehydrogenase / meso-butanediol dehydrogenase / diacetyl reductase|uniref:Butanediol dehydrogenase n=1 Tax=Niallia circulans TaxID=1397 RepID=A0A0J1IIL8_NIACI|nr:2,3-butanediol dehydrogenase [Niallia circulans]KLV25742.1 butanediol dehydrogenase [Niallia circulans]MDR4315827.1 2,3-butanediol dehydrogenase [Niallia circulans]MED3836923.1 2,3-butanediol dehydrogenase [Niallia circulans]MED4244914.1 2,3-butanediol dehydrogenase [Niallia circulans]MED4249273.1 2,3-butanediol dehydrogenase [Niallia circulans]
MKALRWHNQKDIRLENIEEPQVAPGKVKLKVKWCGICGSDLHEYLGGPIFIPVDQPHPLTNEVAPVTLGHEFSGEIVEIGAGVTDYQVGDRVVVEPIFATHGHQGAYNLDENMGFLGLAGGGGGFSEYVSVDTELLHKLPDELSYEQGALVEPSAVALYAVRSSKIQAGDTAAVFGCGPIGLLVIEALKAAGATDIYAVELSPERQAKAEELGAIVVNPANYEDVVAELVRRTNGGVDVSFEVTGVPVVLRQAIQSTTISGETVIVSIWEKGAEILPNDIVIKERTIKGIIGYRDVFPSVLNLMRKGYFSADKLVTKKIKLDEVIEEGFQSLISEKNQVKILVSAE